MIRNLRVTNFRCLRSVRTRLEPLTVLVGSTASGKTAVIDALDPDLSLGSGDYWRHNQNATVGFDLEFDEGPASFRGITTGAIQKVETRPFRKYGYQVLRLDAAKMRLPIRVQHERVLRSDGGNLPNVIASLSRRQQLELSEQLVELIPMFQDVDVRPYQTDTGSHRLLFQDKWRSDVWFTGDQVSDGTLIALALLVLPFQQEIPDLLCVENPERGLHPRLLGEMVRRLRRLADGQAASRPVQVIIATQSAEIMDAAQPDELRFLHRSVTDGGATINELTKGKPDEWLMAYRKQQPTQSTGD